MFRKNDGKARILIVDDEPLIRNLLRDILSENYECVDVGSAEAALSLLEKEQFNLVISDIQMSGISGLEMIPRVLTLAPDNCIIMISGLQTIESPIKAMRIGAFDYITKPFDVDHVEAIVNRALETQSLRLTKRLYESHLEEQIAARTAQLREEILERQRAEEKINRMAYYDSLTNLPNPALFKDRLTHELGRASGSRKKLAVIFFALDRFKSVSDTLGLAAGEELLRDFAERLAVSVRKTDTAAYFGGSEFALLASDLAGAEDCVKLVQEINQSLRHPFNCAGQEVFLTASFGISLTPNDGEDWQSLLQNASTALYRARQNGGDNYQFYTAGMHDLALKNLSLENGLRRGIEREEFVVYYQPQIASETGELTGMEALVRWQHPELGLVSPLEFIPIAEESGLILPLGEWVLKTACEQNAAWQRAGFPPLRVGVNLSPRQFRQSDLVESISRILKDSGLEPQYLELELTESLLMEDVELTIKTLHDLRNLGIKISIDDFGSGYSSLSHLKNLPIDTLKIDRMFIKDITAHSSNEAIVKTIITLAQNLLLKTIAEGVEIEEQSSILSALGCDEMQGFLFSKPLAAAAFEAILSERRYKIVSQ